MNQFGLFEIRRCQDLWLPAAGRNGRQTAHRVDAPVRVVDPPGRTAPATDDVLTEYRHRPAVHRHLFQRAHCGEHQPSAIGRKRRTHERRPFRPRNSNRVIAVHSPEKDLVAARELPDESELTAVWREDKAADETFGRRYRHGQPRRPGWLCLRLPAATHCPGCQGPQRQRGDNERGNDGHANAAPLDVRSSER